jgi:hypothetical protein
MKRRSPLRRTARTPIPIIVPLVALALLIAPAPGCMPSPDGGGNDEDPNDPNDPPGEQCEGPLGAPRDPSALPACCEEFLGNGHCVEASAVPTEVQAYVDTCDAGGYCIPDKFIETGGVLVPKACASLDGAEGVCLSVCIPQVGMYYGILPQDVCDADERCAPCISPLDDMPTGACDIKGECVGGGADDPGEGDPTPADDGDDPSTCVHEGDPVVDPTNLTSCGPDAHCLTASIVPPDFADRLAPCAGDPSTLCVPDLFLVTGGDFVAPSCRSLADSEGRCLSLVLPEVKEQEDLLPQSTCGLGERCVPCFNPLDGVETGACSLSCDTGPVEPARTLPSCCSGIGTCVPDAAIPAEQRDRLGPDECPETDPMLCVPNAFLEGTYTPQPCEAGLIAFLFGEEFREGGCLPECLPDVDGAPFLGQGECADHMKCVPCLDPLSGDPSGACDPIGG